MTRCLLGIDKGTTVIKSVLFDLEGRELSSASRQVEILRSRPGHHEEDPETTWQTTARTVREALERASEAKPDVAAVGISGHMGGLWLVDEDGRALGNGICWPDERALSCQSELEEDGRLDRFFEISGTASMPGITLMLLRHLERSDPEIRAHAASILLAKDYLRFKLTGEIATDQSDVSFVPGDVRERTWSSELLALAEVESWRDRLPPILPSESVAGTVTAEAAAETGLPEGTPVVAGLGDAVANAIGTSTTEPGQAVTVLGTSCLNSLVLDRPELEPTGLGFTFAMPGERWLRILPNTSGTLTLDWFLSRFCEDLSGPDGPRFDEVERLAASAPVGSGGVILLPYLNTSGVLAPFFDARARGAFFGISSHTTRDHLLRAVHEALAFSTRDCFEAMPAMPDRVRLTGGGARSGLWSQMLADVLGRPTEVLEAPESGALGVALLAGVAVGVWPDLPSAVASCLRPARVHEPDAEAQRRYEGYFALYRSVRDALRPLSRRREDVASRPSAVKEDVS